MGQSEKALAKLDFKRTVDEPLDRFLIAIRWYHIHRPVRSCPSATKKNKRRERTRWLNPPDPLFPKITATGYILHESI